MSTLNVHVIPAPFFWTFRIKIFLDDINFRIQNIPLILQQQQIARTHRNISLQHYDALYIYSSNAMLLQIYNKSSPNILIILMILAMIFRHLPVF